MTDTTPVLAAVQPVATQSASAAHAHHAAGHGAGHRRLRFAAHFVEMQVAMCVGMMVGAPLGIPSIPSVELRAAAWLLAMAIPMVAWMRFRGMSLRSGAEMSAAMAVPTLAALPLFWGGVLTAGALISIEHLSMAPAMLVFMALRRRDYGW